LYILWIFHRTWQRGGISHTLRQAGIPPGAEDGPEINGAVEASTGADPAPGADFAPAADIKVYKFNRNYRDMEGPFQKNQSLKAG